MTSKDIAPEAIAPPDQVSTTTTQPPQAIQPPALTELVTVDNTPGNTGASLNIVHVYNQLLQRDPTLAMSTAAIESLIEVLRNSTETTTTGTLVILNEQVAILKAQKNPVSATAGCDLFMQYILYQLRLNGGNIEKIKQDLVKNPGKFRDRAEYARGKVANRGRHFVKNGATILTYGGSRCVGGVLLRAAAADAGPRGEMIDFRVIYVMNKVDEAESQKTIDGLRAKGIPVAQVSEAAVGYCMQKVNAVFVGAEGVVESGGIISRLGTYQIGVIAKKHARPMYAAAELHKFVRMFPLGQNDIPVDQNVIDFKTADDIAAAKEKEKEKEEGAGDPTDYFDAPTQSLSASELGEFVDYTPPEYIEAIVTEDGPLTTAQVSHYLINVYSSS